MHLTKDNQWSEYRGLSSAIWPTLGVCGAYSMGGTATMLMLEPDNNYDAEVVMFGGFRREKRKSSTLANGWQGTASKQMLP